MPTTSELGQKVKLKYPGTYDDLSDIEVGQKVKLKFPGSYDDYTDTEPGKYDVPNLLPKALTPEQKQQRLVNAQAQAQKAQTEAKKVNSIFGLVGNTLKETGKTFIASELGLGDTLGKIGSAKNLDTYTENINKLTQSQIQLQKLIKEREAKGINTDALKRTYNSNQDQIEQNKAEITKYGAELPSTGKVLGQIGGTALDVLTAGTYGKVAQGMRTGVLAKSTLPFAKKVATASGLPELGKLAEQKASGLFTKKGLANVGKGFGVGYASDVTQGLQGFRGEDRTGGKALIPGFGTAIGTGIPVISEGTQTVRNLRDPEFKAQKLVEKRQKGLDKLDSYQTLKKATEKGRERGIDVKKVLSETDVLHGSVDKTGTITTKGEGGAVEMYTKEFIDGNENIVSELLKKENRAISPALVKTRLIQKVKNAGIEGKNLTSALKAIDDEVAGYMLRANEQGNIPVSIIHDAKIDKYNGINFFTEGATKKYDKTVANALKELVEESTTSVDVQKINKELSKHFAVIDYLNKLDGKKVEGGKLGKYFAQTVGTMVGSHFGPLGAVVGAEAGGRIKGETMSRAFSGKTGKIPEQSQVMKNAIDIRDASPLRLPQSKSNNLGNLQTNQIPTNITTKNGISNIIPEETYLGQGKRELGEISGQVKDFIKNPKIGLSIEDVSKNPLQKTKLDLASSGSEYLSLVDSGYLSKADLYRPDGTLKPKFMEHVVSDLAGKLDDYSEGLGKKFKNTVNLDNPTLENLIDEATKFANKAKSLPKNVKIKQELLNLDTSVPTINGKPGVEAITDDWFRLDQLKEKVNKKGLSSAEYKEANTLLDKVLKKSLPQEQSLINEAKKYKSAEDFAMDAGSIKDNYDWDYLDEMKAKKKKGYAISQSDFNYLSKIEKELRGKESKTFYRAGEINRDGDIWLTPQQSGAEQYGNAGGTKVGEYKVLVQKPLILKDLEDIEKVLGRKLDSNSYFANNPDLKEAVINYAKKNGYDSAMFPDSFPDGGSGMESLVVWDKNKIKTKSQLTDIWNKVNKK